ncbi:MAG: SHOCT domain-containing protein [Aeromicrobium sp.]
MSLDGWVPYAIAALVFLGGPAYRYVRKASGGTGRTLGQKLGDKLDARLLAQLPSQQALFESGVRAIATITSVTPSGSVVNNINVATGIGLHLEPPTGAPYDVEQGLMVLESTLPRVGQKIRVGIDPDNPQRVALEADWTAATGGGLALRAYDDPAAAPAAATGAPTPDRLDELADLGRRHAAGDLTDEQFTQEKSRILGTA